MVEFGPEILEEITQLAFSNIGGLPTIAIMGMPFIVGLVIGFFIKKILKVAVILAIIAVIASYFGFVNLSGTFEEIKVLAAQYGPEVLTYISLAIGVLPLGIGLVVGIIAGFLLG